ncbi:MarP family serine protease [Actinoplanes auranticolor]|uniref:Serine protease n=1 Tax=Actinoplanes auranticolor TaxID=47988 RepID=A0A919VI28_9ACTN|nr:MarP family serine protease [Actinoplanes auranticolor]GIM62985.1 serine protease [Actinoplanes auranticolor]
MPVVDGFLILLMVAFAVGGYRQGFVVGALSFGGFFSGLLIGLQIGPLIAGQFADGAVRLVVALVTILALAVLGQTLAGWLGTRLRGTILSPSAQRLDDGGGAAVSLVAVLVVAGLLAVPLASTPFPGLNKQVRSSAVLQGVDRLLPPQAQALSAGLRESLRTDGFPDVFAGLAGTGAAQVPAPDPRLAEARVVTDARRSVIKVRGTSCTQQIEGSGFVYAPERVMTNAHVVAGTSAVRVETRDGPRDGTVVVFDPERDLAVIYVPGLRAPVLPFVREPAAPGADAIVLGYPLNGPYNAQAARVRESGDITGPAIDDSADVTREIYTIRALVRRGNSGGPLVAPNGDVLGVIFAVAREDRNVGFALTAAEASGPAKLGADRTRGVETGACG